MTTQVLLDPTGDSTAHIDVDVGRGPVRVVGAFIRRHIDRAVGRLAVNIATLLVAFDHCLVALDDDLDAVIDI